MDIKKRPLFSIIICLHVISDRFYADLKHYMDLTCKDFEIILVTDYKAKLKKTILPHVRIIPTKRKNITLGEKRDIGFLASRGTYCAYIDDDAYPHPDWLTHALLIFRSDKKIGAVGGPNVTPPDDSYWSKIGGHILESYVTSGSEQVRYVLKHRTRKVELQGVNMIIKKSVLQEIGGFVSKLYSGDDSLISSKIRKMNYAIVSDPSVIVYHHRRSFPSLHLKQIMSMGRHRGNFVKIYPQTLAPIYFLPLILTVGCIGGFILALCIPLFRLPYALIFLFFYMIGYYSSIRYAGYRDSFIVTIGIICTHIAYGISFVQGLIQDTVVQKEYE